VRPNNDNNVYILGAGFSAEAGLPLIASFLGRMHDAVDWLEQNERDEERSAIERVLQFRHESAAAGYRINIDLDNIEHLSSLAAANPGPATTEDIRLAIAPTLDFAAHTSSPLIARLRVSEAQGWPSTEAWRHAAKRWTQAGDGFDDVECSVYDYYAALLSGLAAAKRGAWTNTVITLNYDLLLETSLARLAIPFAYGLRGPGVEYDSAAEAQDTQANAFRILKLHGSLNWAQKEDGPVIVYRDYESVRSSKLRPLLVPRRGVRASGILFFVCGMLLCRHSQRQHVSR
jgi:hypothetical protein